MAVVGMVVWLTFLMPWIALTGVFSSLIYGSLRKGSEAYDGTKAGMLGVGCDGSIRLILTVVWCRGAVLDAATDSVQLYGRAERDR